MSKDPTWAKVLESPGLVAIGLGGRRRRYAKKVRDLTVRYVWNRFVGAFVGAVASGVAAKIVVSQLLG